MCSDPYGRWELGHRTGVILRRASMTCWIRWDDTLEVETWNEGDLRYKVDTNRARITAPPGQTILDAKRSD